MAEWSGALVSPPAMCRLQVQCPSPIGHVIFPATGASVNESTNFSLRRWMHVTMKYTGLWVEVGRGADPP